MNDDELCQAVIKKIKPFFKAHLTETPIFHVILGSHHYTGQLTQNVIKVTNRKGFTILSLTVHNNIRFDNTVVNTILVDITLRKYVPLYNKFLKYFKERSSDSFSLYMNAAKEKSESLKLIQDIKVLPYAKRTLKFKENSNSVLMNAPVHAKVTTPFETFDVVRIPKFLFEDDQLYLNDDFHFISYGLDFSFCKKIEKDLVLLNNAVSFFSNQFYVLHKTNIVGSLCRLYNMKADEANALTDEELIAYYPTLAMEHY